MILITFPYIVRCPLSDRPALRLGSVDSVVDAEEGRLADLIQVHLDRVPGVTALEVALEDLLDELYVLLLVEGLGEKARIHYLDAVLAQEPIDLLDLVGREIDLLQEVEDVAGLQGAGLLAGLEEFLYLLYVPQIALGLQEALLQAETIL